MKTYLVAVSAPTEQDVIDFLLASSRGPKSEDPVVEEWWIAEDDRHDGSDNDSAIFVPRGSQQDMRAVIRAHLDGVRPYPYTATDVTGGWA